jgi:hypothetical protein
MRFAVSILVAGLVCMVVTLAAGARSQTSPPPDPGGRTRDCTTEARLSPESQTVIRYVVWCGAQRGRVTLRIHRHGASPPIGFSQVAQARGPGASGPLRCRPHRGGRAFCTGRKRGPVTFRGSVTVARGTRCAGKLSLNVWRWTGDSLDFPSGCPRAYAERERRIPEIIEQRAYYGLDRDLDADRAAIVRRTQGLLAAWRRGDPVARWTSEEEAFGMPLRAFEQVELEYRDAYREHFQDLVEGSDWVKRNAASTWAGYELDEAAGGIIYVGFTAEPEAMLEKLRRHLIAPDRFRLFPIKPRYTESHLEAIWESFPAPKSPLWDLVNMSGIDYLANKIEVGTEHVARVRRLIAAEYGPEAPFEVVFSRPAVLLAGSATSAAAARQNG